MVFLEYARRLSPQRDPLKVKILTDPKLTYPRKTLDRLIPELRLPEPVISEEEIEFLLHLVDPSSIPAQGCT